MAKSFWDKEENIIEIEKNKSENIIVKECSKNEKEYVDIRISKVDKEGIYHPTSSGVVIPKEGFDKIIFQFTKK